MKKKNEFKIVFIGTNCAGKTNIINRFISNKYDENSGPTTVSFSSRQFELEFELYTINIFDTVGASAFRKLVKIYLPDSDGVVVVYDITNKNSFDEIDEYIKSSKEVENNEIPMIVIGNKPNLYEIRNVTEEEGELKAKKYGAEFIETSALSGENIEKA